MARSGLDRLTTNVQDNFARSHHNFERIDARLESIDARLAAGA